MADHLLNLLLKEDRSNLDAMLDKGFNKGVPVRAEVRMSLLGGRTGIFSLLSTPLEEEGRIYSLSSHRQGYHRYQGYAAKAYYPGQ